MQPFLGITNLTGSTNLSLARPAPPAQPEETDYQCSDFAGTLEDPPPAPQPSEGTVAVDVLVDVYCVGSLRRKIFQTVYFPEGTTLGDTFPVDTEDPCCACDSRLPSSSAVALAPCCDLEGVDPQMVISGSGACDCIDGKVLTLYHRPSAPLWEAQLTSDCPEIAYFRFLLSCERLDDCNNWTLYGWCVDKNGKISEVAQESHLVCDCDDLGVFSLNLMGCCGPINIVIIIPPLSSSLTVNSASSEFLLPSESLPMPQLPCCGLESHKIQAAIYDLGGCECLNGLVINLFGAPTSGGYGWGAKVQVPCGDNNIILLLALRCIAQVFDGCSLWLLRGWCIGVDGKAGAVGDYAQLVCDCEAFRPLTLDLASCCGKISVVILLPPQSSAGALGSSSATPVPEASSATVEINCGICTDAPYQWLVSADGIGNSGCGPSGGCADQNGPWLLTHAPPEQQDAGGCTWLADELTLACDIVGPFTGPAWRLGYDPATDRWFLVSLIQQNTSSGEYILAGADWDCTGPNVLTLTSPSSFCDLPNTVILQPV